MTVLIKLQADKTSRDKSTDYVLVGNKDGPGRTFAGQTNNEVATAEWKLWETKIKK